MLPHSGLEVASNAPLRDGGTTCYEGGVRVPAIVRWPGRVPAGSECREMLSQLDVLPLCLAAAGQPSPRDRILDGRDPLRTLAGRAKSPHERLFFGFAKTAGMREGDFKLVRSDPKKPWELYDLASDLGEQRNLAAGKPEVVVRLDAAFRAWLVAVKEDASEARP